MFLLFIHAYFATKTCKALLHISIVFIFINPRYKNCHVAHFAKFKNILKKNFA